MGKYIVEVLVVGLLCVAVAPFAIGALSIIRKRFAKAVEEATQDEDKDA